MKTSKNEVPDIIRWPTIVGLAFFIAAAIAVRTVWLNNIPGLNGDEAWAGNQAVGGHIINWRTPEGTFVSPFYLLPLAFFERIFPPAFWVLRLPMVLVGILLIVLGWLLFRRSISPAAGIAFAILAAGSPDLIAYSRISWIPSEAALATLIVIHLAFNRRWWWVLLAEAVAVVVYPTNIFLAPILLPLFFVDLFKVPSNRRTNLTILATMVFVALILVLFLLMVTIHRDPLAFINLGQTYSRISSIREWAKLLLHYGELISGVTIYRYFVGPFSLANRLVHDLVFSIAFVPLVGFGRWRLIKKSDFRAPLLLTGIGLSLLSFFVITTNPPLAPGYERYGQFLVVPTLVLFSMCAGELFSSKLGIRRFTNLALLIGCVSLVSFVMDYFVPILQTGGQTHRTYRTASIDPKAQAVSALLNDGAAECKATVLAEDWWSAQPIRYLLAPYHNIEVVQFDAGDMDTAQIQKVLNTGGYVVGFSENYFDSNLDHLVEIDKLIEWDFLDYGGHPVLKMWRMRVSPDYGCHQAPK